VSRQLADRDRSRNPEPADRPPARPRAVLARPRPARPRRPGAHRMNTTSPRVGEGALPLLGRECPAAPVDQGTRSTAGSGTHRTASTAGGGQPPRGSSAPTPPDSTWPRLRLAAIAIMVGERSRPTRRPPPSPSHTRDAATPCPHPTSRTSSASSIPQPLHRPLDALRGSWRHARSIAGCGRAVRRAS